MRDKMEMARVLDEAMKTGADFAELYIEEKQLCNIWCEDDRIERINQGREKGAGVRVVQDGFTAYVYTSDLSEDSLCQAARTARQAAREGNLKQTAPVSLCVKPPRFKLECKQLPGEVTLDQKIAVIQAANTVARNLSREIKQVTVGAGDMNKTVIIANSEGQLVADARKRIRLAVNTVASREGIIQTGLESYGGVCGWELLNEVNFDDLARQAGNRALKMLEARPAPAGSMPVVMSSEAGGTMVHEACGHGLEADLVQKGLSVYQARHGEQVASPCVTVIDDATLPGRYGSLVFDDEGSYGQRTVLIEKGVLKSFMYDRLTAIEDNTESTGNGRRESYQHKPIPRMTNTLIAPGKDDADEIIRSTPAGLLVTKMGGGQVNTTNGDFVFEVQEGYIIKDGEIQYPVRGATLIGNGPEALNSIDRVGRDLGFAIGVCGKDGQGVPVSDAQPTIRITGLTVGGTSLAGKPAKKKIRRL